ncbi:DDE_3 domain-containing protein [Trichonephila clavipes]|nr:DDE_3 domain-containing protein [Trichonephila clavipes]
MLNGRTLLHVLERDSVNGVRYRVEILETYVRLLRGVCGSEFILMDDNARPHRALLFDKFLKSQLRRRSDARSCGGSTLPRPPVALESSVEKSVPSKDANIVHKKSFHELYHSHFHIVSKLNPKN